MLPFAWHREDSGYLAAAVGAAAVVAYLVFGNFGIIPSPFAAPNGAPEILAAIEPVLAPAPQTDVEVPRVAAPPPVDTVTPPAPAPPRPVDEGPPKVAVSTPPGTTFSLTEPALIEGTVTDTGTGVAVVAVVFAPTSGSKQTVTADVTCFDATRRSCAWRAEVPAAVAEYVVTAVAVDRAGNKANDAIEIMVVNTGGAVKQITGVVERVPTVLEKAATGLLGGL